MTTYLVWCPEYGQSEDDARRVNAWDANAAACEWAEWYDARSADYLIVGGSEVTVVVRAANKPEEWRLIVSGESVAHYRARGAVAHPMGKEPQPAAKE